MIRTLALHRASLALLASLWAINGCFLFEKSKNTDSSVAQTEAPDFSHSIRSIDDLRKLAVTLPDGTTYLKFLWDFKQPDQKFWFMNTNKFPMHDGFLREHFKNRYPEMNPAIYERIALNPESQEIVTGAIYFGKGVQGIPNWTQPNALGFSLYFEGTPIRHEQIALVYENLIPALSFGGDMLVYAFDSLPLWMRNKIKMDNVVRPSGAKGVPSTHLGVFLKSGDKPKTYNASESFGYLRIVTHAEFETGTYDAKDILAFSDHVPIDIGPVSGVISPEDLVPHSHVIFRTKNQKIPCISIPKFTESQAAKDLAGKLVKFRTNEDGTYALEPANPQEAEAYFAGCVPVLPEIRANLSTTTLYPYTKDLAFDENIVTSYGAKGKNFAHLDKKLRENGIDRKFTDGGFLIPYAFYDMHMKQPLKDSNCKKAQEKCSGVTPHPACQALAEKCLAGAQASQKLGEFILAQASGPQAQALVADGALRKSTLEFVRRLIRTTKLPDSVYTPVLNELKAITAAHTLPDRAPPRIRLRSSTNAEDLPGLTGAGLYTSKSACVADIDSSANESKCLTASEKERIIARKNGLTAQRDALMAQSEGERDNALVARLNSLIQEYEEKLTDKDEPNDALRGVYASLWNERAFLNREYYRIPHDKVYMGVLAHPSFSDETLNGVITATKTAEGKLQIDAVVQRDDISITNPEIPGAIPEIVRVESNLDGSGASRRIIGRSNQTGGGEVMTEAMAASLARQVAIIYGAFNSVHPTGYEVLDIEIKTTENEIRIKQARPL